MASEITVDVVLAYKLRWRDIFKLRLCGIKGKTLIDEIMQRMKAPTCVLVNDLAKREGVKEFVVNPHCEFTLYVADKDGETAGRKIKSTGPARILVVID